MKSDLPKIGLKFRHKGNDVDVFEIIDVQPHVITIISKGHYKKWPTKPEDVKKYFETGFWIPINRLPRMKNDGLFCESCGYYHQFAEPNQPNGGLICFKCRSGF